MNRFKRVVSGTSAAVLSLSSLLTMGFTGVAHAAVQTCTWTGTAGDKKFSTATNWSNCGGGAPQAGDIIRFDQMQSTTVALTNDLNVDLGGLVSVAVPLGTNHAGYSVDKLAFAAGAAVTVEKASTCSISVPSIAPTSVTGAGDLTVFNSVLGWSPYKLVTSGKLTIESIYGIAVSSFSSGSSAGSVTVASPLGWEGITTATGCQSGGGGASGVGVVHNDLNNMTYGSVTVENGATISLTDYSKPMTFGGGSGTDNPAVNFDPDTDPDTSAALVSNRTWSSAVTLLSDTEVYVGDKVAVSFTGTITGAGKSLTKLTNSTGTFTNNATSNTSATPSGAQTNPVKVTALDGTTADYVTVVSNETATLNGQRASMNVLPGGTLKGTGTLTAGLYVADGGRVAPGNSPGCLSADTLSMQGEYQFELGGTDSCSGYDQIKVTNKTATYPTVALDQNGTSTSVLATTRFNGYTPKQGQTFTIIDNQGTQAVQGVFKDLPEGATFTQNGVVFKITYKGGDGNDVVLTVQNQPTAPDTGFALVSANPLLTLGATAGAALLLLGMARKTRPAHARAHTTRRRK